MRIIFLLPLLFAIFLSVGPAAAEAPPLPSDLEARQIAAGSAQDDGSNWLLYGGSYKAWRYSLLDEINKNNVKDLELVWTLATGMHDAFEASPIVVDGVMYFSTSWNHVYAVEAATGTVLWHYAYELPASLPLCCGAVNRGVAVGRGKVYMAALDATLLALDARTGDLVWKEAMALPKDGYSATIAPQIIGNKIVLGNSGGDFGTRGFVDAYDADTGVRLWRFWTVPAPGEPGSETWSGDSWKTGGGPAWMTPTYEPETHTIYVGTGNPGPDITGESRQGDNLYTECIVALDAETGARKWHYQTVPHDVWDLDNVTEPLIADLTIDGKARKVVLFASKNGYFYVLDRTDGAFIYAVQFVHKLDWGRVNADGTVTLDKSKFPVKDKWTTVYPGAAGGKEWCPVAYDPQRKRVFIPVIENGHRHKVIEQEFRPGLLYWGGVSEPVPNEAYGHIMAIDVETGNIAWDTETEFPVVAGVTCTAGGLVITGTPDQKMLFLDADTGNVLRTFTAASGWHSAPVTFKVNGRQYIAFANGWGGWVAGFDLMGTPELEDLPRDNVMYVFARKDNKAKEKK
ncbi:MAG: PQQ-dependent dehydrogenase, methanol/ethanol family [Syntrophales bacterium]|jgi:alcohol dehydrogenase (cytochrome c)|nr:PQQ-dependent dehydrogenase, methanol/ethanol family [Syntrophales bacterium]MDY0044575.1 PQQ-dependent dehydrogenase, methanol/ethanol family [Syntrophales bacterium]